MRSAILWLHVLCGVVWVGASASFVLAASALSTESGEWREFALSVAPRINRISLVVAAIIPVTGIGNLIYVGLARQYVFPPEFIGILAAKIALYTTMVLALVAAWHAEARLRSASDGCGGGARAELRRLIWLYGATVASGVAALALGLWLSGVK
ncbi:MAG: hypothetical protein ACREQX_03720 [Candidatus Binataceae bacterium]